MKEDSPTVKIFDHLTATVLKMNFDDESDSGNLLIDYDKFHAFLIESGAQKPVRRAAASLYHAIAKKQHDVVLSYKTSEQNGKRLNRIIFYILETFLLIVFAGVTITAIAKNASAIVITSCVAALLVFSVVLLFIHIGKDEEATSLLERFLDFNRRAKLSDNEKILMYDRLIADMEEKAKSAGYTSYLEDCDEDEKED